MNPNTASDHRIHAFQLNITEQRSFQWQELHSGDLEIRNTGDENSVELEILNEKQTVIKSYRISPDTRSLYSQSEQGGFHISFPPKEPDESEIQIAISFENENYATMIWAAIDSIHRRLEFFPNEISIQTLGDVVRAFEDPAISVIGRLEELKYDDCNYVKRLVRFMRNSMDFAESLAIEMMVRIAVRLVQIDDPAILEVLVVEESVRTVAELFAQRNGCVAEASVALMLKKCNPKPIIPILDAYVLKQMNRYCRMELLRELCTERISPEHRWTTFNRLQSICVKDVLGYIEHSASFRDDLFDMLDNDATLDKGLLVLHEFCYLRLYYERLSRETSAQPSPSTIAAPMPKFPVFVRTLCSTSQFYEILSKQLANPKVSEHHQSLVVFLRDLTSHWSEANHFRTGLQSEQPPPVVSEPFGSHELLKWQPGSSLWTSLIVSATTQPCVRDSAFDLLTNLFSNVNTTSLMTQNDGFLNVFYDHYITYLILPLYHTSTSIELKIKICAFLGQCVSWHGYRMRFILPQHPILATVFEFLQSKNRQIVCIGVEFIKNCVCQTPRKVSSGIDTAYHRQLISNRAFGPLMEVLKNDGMKFSLVFSSIMGLFSWIRTTKSQALIDHLADTYDLSSLPCKTEFELLQLASTENRSSEDDRSGAITPRDHVDAVEEQYFANEEDEATEEQIKSVSDDGPDTFIPMPRPPVSNTALSPLPAAPSQTKRKTHGFAKFSNIKLKRSVEDEDGPVTSNKKLKVEEDTTDEYGWMDENEEQVHSQTDDLVDQVGSMRCHSTDGIENQKND